MDSIISDEDEKELIHHGNINRNRRSLIGFNVTELCQRFFEEFFNGATKTSSLQNHLNENKILFSILYEILNR